MISVHSFLAFDLFREEKNWYGTCMQENFLLSMPCVLSDREGREKRCLAFIEKIALF